MNCKGQLDSIVSATVGVYDFGEGGCTFARWASGQVANVQQQVKEDRMKTFHRFICPASKLSNTVLMKKAK